MVFVNLWQEKMITRSSATWRKQCFSIAFICCSQVFNWLFKVIQISISLGWLWNNNLVQVIYTYSGPLNLPPLRDRYQK